MKAIPRNQAEIMLTMQAAMNSKINTGWIDAGFPYLRAVVIEGAEAIEHHGWKWWKQQHCDVAQLQMEIVDIWHFMLSALLIKTRNDHQKALHLLLAVNEADFCKSYLDFDGRRYELSSLDLLEKLELLIGVSVSRRIELELFRGLLQDCNMEWDELYKQYVSKNVLNFFRQDHGYKEGTYQKIWQGKEDNEHLVEVIGELNPLDPQYPEKLYQFLKDRYQR